VSVGTRKTRTNQAVFVAFGAGAVLAVGALCATVGTTRVTVPCIFTEAPRYEPKAWLDGRDRFPAGATLRLVIGETRRDLAPGFYASADATVSDDGRSVLFSGKRSAGAHWQIWEVAVSGGTPRQITQGAEDRIRPLYLPPNQIVYTRSAPDGSDIEIAGKPSRLTFVPGRYLTDEVLADGRILFEADQGSRRREIYTVYPDGTGVESVRCDHGRDRGEARQVASGDYIFHSGNRLARFTSGLAEQTDVAQPVGDAAGPIAEMAPDVWLVSLRGKAGRFGLYRWSAVDRQTVPVETPSNASAVEPVIVAARIPPREFPSGLVPTRTAGNLLCLNARVSRTPINGAAVHMVRAYTQGADGKAALLGQTEVEGDGSFYIQVPADKPLRMELVDGSGKTVQAEHGWFWMRPSEQRICVGCHTGPERAPENKVPEILLRTIVPVKMLEVQP
jgi:hypothetical protein